MPATSPWPKILILGLLIATIPTLLLQATLFSGTTFKAALSRFTKSTALSKTSYNITKQRHLATNATMTRTPVYFFSHGGPNVMEETQHPAYKKLQELGREITQKVKPKAVLVVSGHWEGYHDTVEVNTAETQGLIYDFYGFPAHFYEFQYPHKGSPELAEKILGKLKDAGIKGEGVRRGLDHGVWASFMCAFDPKENPLEVPIVQVSLFGDENPDIHYNLGKALSPLRDEGVQIIVSGMSVHNLRDMWTASMKPGPMPYTTTFEGALKDAVEQPPEDRQKAMAALMKRADARKAHPSWDHLLPIYVGAGAAAEEKGQQLWALPEGSMSWGMYRFGEVSA